MTTAGGGRGGSSQASEDDGVAGAPPLSVDAGKIPDLVLYMLTEDEKDFVPDDGKCTLTVRGLPFPSVPWPGLALCVFWGVPVCLKEMICHVDWLGLVFLGVEWVPSV